MNTPHSPPFLQSLIGLDCTLCRFRSSSTYVIVDVIPPAGRNSRTDMMTPIDLVLHDPNSLSDSFTTVHLADIKLTPTSQATFFSRIGKTSDQEQ